MTCYPAAFEEKMRPLLGAEADAFFASYSLPSVHGLRVNPQKIDPAAFAAMGTFALSPIPWCAEGFYLSRAAAQRPGKHPYHEAGVYYLQEPSAMAVAGLLDAQPGENVLDLCAAPGGKSTQIAARLGADGLLIANEIHPARAKELSSNIERLGFANTVVTCAHPAQLAARFPGFFDRVLVDAPCSGEGMFRKNPEVQAHWSQANVLACRARQQEVLGFGAQMLRPGGRLVYSTCTFSPEEDEQVIARFLQQHPSFEIEAVHAPDFDAGRPAWSPVPLPQLSHTFRLWPHKLRGEGHYIAVLRDTSDGVPLRPAPMPLLPDRQRPKAYLAFAEQALHCALTGPLLRFDRQLHRPPHGLPDLSGLKVLRCGLHLGTLQKERFVPSHALSHFLLSTQAACVCDLPAGAAEVTAYLQGQALPYDGPKGWTLVCADSFPLGWAKASDGQLKNHFPKGLRWL